MAFNLLPQAILSGATEGFAQAAKDLFTQQASLGGSGGPSIPQDGTIESMSTSNACYVVFTDASVFDDMDYMQLCSLHSTAINKQMFKNAVDIHNRKLNKKTANISEAELKNIESELRVLEAKDQYYVSKGLRKTSKYKYVRTRYDPLLNYRPPLHFYLGYPCLVCQLIGDFDKASGKQYLACMHGPIYWRWKDGIIRLRKALSKLRGGGKRGSYLSSRLEIMKKAVAMYLQELLERTNDWNAKNYGVYKKSLNVKINPTPEVHNTILSAYARITKSFQSIFYRLGGFNRPAKSAVYRGNTPLQKRARIQKAQYQQRSFKRNYAARKLQKVYRKYATKKRVARARVQQRFTRYKLKKNPSFRYRGFNKYNKRGRRLYSKR